MKVIIAGSREINITVDAMSQIVRKSGWMIDEVVSGEARGVDRTAKQYAINYGIKYKPFPADWSKYGKAAGPIRNKEMAEYGDALIAIWDSKSRGTEDMIQQAIENNLKVYTHECEG